MDSYAEAGEVSSLCLNILFYYLFISDYMIPWVWEFWFDRWDFIDMMTLPLHRSVW